MRVKRIVTALLFALLPVSAPCRELPKFPITKPIDAQGKAPFSLAISGGISLGSYEAGMNWAFLKYLKNRRLAGVGEPPEMASVAGASAGGINALFSAITWCLDDAKAAAFRFQKATDQTENSVCRQGASPGTGGARADAGADHFGNDVQRNLFRRMWLGVDFETLVPREREKYDRTDGLLSRCAFEPVLEDLRQVVEAPIFRPDCSVPVGIILTREQVEFAKAGPLAAANDRFVLTLQARSYRAEDGYRLRFEPYIADPNRTELGNTIILPVELHNGVYESPFEGVKRAVEASSAFPLAFGPVDLRHCLQKAGAPGSGDCPKGYELKFGRDGRFVDGGVFDNIPLGTAKALAEPYRYEEIRLPQPLLGGNRGEAQGNGAVKPVGNYTYIYMDPGHKRDGALPESAKKEAQQRPSYGLFGGSAFLSGAIESARKHELYDQLRSGMFAHQSNVLSRIVTQRVTEQYDVRGLPEVTDADCAATSRLDLATAPTVVACIKRGQDRINIDSALTAPPETPELERGLQELRRLQFGYLQKVAVWLGDTSLLGRLTTAKEDRYGERRALISSRFAPLTGNYLGAFGAFIDPDFRSYDYYVGVYDAIQNLAADACPLAPVAVQGTAASGAPLPAAGAAEEVYRSCLKEKMQRLALELGVTEDPDGAAVFNILAQGEYRWGTTPADGSRNVKVLAGTFTDSRLEAVPSFRELVESLKTNRDFRPRGEMLRKTMAMQAGSDLEILQPLASRILVRARDEEIVETEENGKANLWHAIPFLNLVVARALGNTERFVPNQGHATNRLWTLLPWEISTDLVNGGVDLSWEPRYLLDSKYSANAKLTVGLDSFSGKESWYGGADAYLAYRNNFLGVGAGPGISRPFRKVPGYSGVGFGVSGFVEILDALRFTVGTRNVERDDYYFLFGFTDIPGRVEAIFKSLLPW